MRDGELQFVTKLTHSPIGTRSEEEGALCCRRDAEVGGITLYQRLFDS